MMRFTVCALLLVGAGALKVMESQNPLENETAPEPKEAPDFQAMLKNAMENRDAASIREVLEDNAGNEDGPRGDGSSFDGRPGRPHVDPLTEQNKTDAKKLIEIIIAEDEEALVRAVNDPESDYLKNAIDKAEEDEVDGAKLAPALEEMKKRKEKETKRAQEEEKRRATLRSRRVAQEELKNRMRSREDVYEEGRRNAEHAALKARREADQRHYQAMQQRLEEKRRAQMKREYDEIDRAETIHRLQVEYDAALQHKYLAIAVNGTEPSDMNNQIRSADEHHVPLTDEERRDTKELKARLTHKYFAQVIDTEDSKLIEHAIDLFGSGWADVEMTKEERDKAESRRDHFLKKKEGDYSEGWIQKGVMQYITHDAHQRFHIEDEGDFGEDP